MRSRSSLPALTILGLAASAQAQAATSPIAVTPLTAAASVPPSGYFQDPYPIRLRGAAGRLPLHLFSGTTTSFLVCPGSLQTTCIEAGEVTLDPGTLGAQAAAAGATLGVADNFNVFEDRHGNLHMVATYYVTNPSAPAANGPWTVVVHAHPASAGDVQHWHADALLAGSFTTHELANYDGKFIENDGTLYLIYSRNLSVGPTRDGLVAQRMQSATQPASDAPVLLLEPKPGVGYASERFDENAPPDGMKLVETGNITRIDGKYALAYSTGRYDERDYKSGVAWSDTFLPAAGTTYRKVLRPDPTHVWSSPGPDEVQYLLQSEKPLWPNDIAASVIAPGVPSILKDADGSWHLVFAGYAPDDAPTSGGVFDATYRRPYAVTLRVDIPEGATVAGASDAALAQWITPVSP